jgi:putative flippase GtrA
VSLASYLWRHPFIRFGAVGAAGYLVNFAALFAGTRYLGLGKYVGGAFSIFVAMGFTWAGNRYFTFAERRARGSLRAVGREYLAFVGANLVGAVVNYLVYAALLRFAGPPFDDKYVAQLSGVLAGLLFNFVLSRQLVFRGGR